MNPDLLIRHAGIRLLLLTLFTGSATAQSFRKTLDRLVYRSLSDTTAPGQSSFRIYPTLGYAPETSVELGFSTLYLYQAKKDTLNRFSEINAFTFVTLRGQYGIWLDNALYGHRDRWFVLGKVRFQRFPLLYYGVGPYTTDEHPAVIDARYFIFRQRVLRKILPNFFAGPELDYQHLSRTKVEHHEEDPHKEFPTGSEGSANLGLGGALVYDNRHNVFNVRKGYFGEIGMLWYNRSLGSAYTFSVINADVRGYHPVRKNNVLAWQFNAIASRGTIPFNQMALMGGESMMRGYYQGRYRDKHMLAAQAEFRMLPLPFSKRFGATVFAGTAMVAPALNRYSLDQVRVAGGAGLRYLLFPRKDIFLRFDVAATLEGVNFYIFTGEAF